MAKQTTHSHRRNLVTPSLLSQPKTSMNSTLKRHPKSNPITATTTEPHPTPPSDPTLSSSTTTIHTISHHFSKLYSRNKVLASLKGSHSTPQINNHLQPKGLSNSTVLETSCTALTKSNSQHVRKVSAADVKKMSTGTKVKEKDKNLIIKKCSHQEQKFNEVKKSVVVKEEYKKEEFYEGKDVKKASALMSKSLESDELKRVNCEVSDEIKRPSMSLAVVNGGGGGGGRRRSFCCSQTELADFFSCSGVKVVAVDMPPFMQIQVVDCARKTYDSLEKFTSKTLALTLKREFDGVYGPAWHCIVGTSFGSFVTHSVGGFMYFSMDQKLYILLFKTTVQRAD